MRVYEASPQLKISGLNNCVMYHRVSLKNPFLPSQSRTCAVAEQTWAIHSAG